MSGKCETQGEAGQRIVCGRVDGGKEYLFGATSFVLVVSCYVLGQIVGKGVRVKIDECAKQHTKLRCIQDGRGVLKDVVEGGLAAFDDFDSAIMLGLNLRLLPFELLVLRSSSLRWSSSSNSALCRSNSASRSAASSSVSVSCGGGIVGTRWAAASAAACGSCKGAMLVRANGELATKLLSIDDDGRFGGFARHHWFRVRVVDHGVKLPNMAALHRSGSLLLGIAPTVLDLNEAGRRCNLPV